jgi:hypothetical protein
MPRDLRSKAFVPLESEEDPWWIWKWVCLRGTGFPTSLILRLAAPESARAADEVNAAEDEASRTRDALRTVLSGDFSQLPTEAITALRRARKKLVKDKLPDAEDLGALAGAELALARDAEERVIVLRERYARAFAAERAEVSRALADTAATPRFREAIAWQNRAALETALDPLVRDPVTDNSSNEKKRDLVTNYLQRYCTKNDTIGFFGPVGWALLTDESDGFTVAPGPDLVARRGVYFEQWAVDVLAKKIGTDLELDRWFIPRVLPFVRIEGRTATSAISRREELTHADVEIIACCNGVALAGEIAESLIRRGEFGREKDVLQALRALAKRKLIAFELEVPLVWEADQSLRRSLERVDDEMKRAEALAMLDELTAKRDAVAAAAGDAKAIVRALTDLEETFTRVTGLPAVRNAGMMYAGRQVVFQDCLRDVDVEIGRKLLDDVAPALRLVLDAARWLTGEAARVYGAALMEAYEDVAKRKGARTVPLSDYWFRVQRVFHGTAIRLQNQIVEELTTRWARVLGPIEEGARNIQLSSSELRAKVHAEFGAAGTGGGHTKAHSPDLMVVAPSADAIERGEALVVLGEVHVGVNTLGAMAFAGQLPVPEDADVAFAELNGDEPFVIPVAPKDWPRATARSVPYGLPEATTWYLETNTDPAPAGRERVLALTELSVVDDDGRIVVRGPRGFEMGLVAFFGEALAGMTASAFRFLSPRAHAPRIAIDKLVIARETWTVAAEDLAFANAKEPDERFRSARRWAASIGLPRMFFVKSPIEVKPVFVDLSSPTLVTMLSKLARNAAKHPGGGVALVITEMLPSLDETWLADADGGRYTSELRIAALDTRATD